MKVSAQSEIPTGEIKNTTVTEGQGDIKRIEKSAAAASHNSSVPNEGQKEGGMISPSTTFSIFGFLVGITFGGYSLTQIIRTVTSEEKRKALLVESSSETNHLLFQCMMLIGMFSIILSSAFNIFK